MLSSLIGCFNYLEIRLDNQEWLQYILQLCNLTVSRNEYNIPIDTYIRNNED